MHMSIRASIVMVTFAAFSHAQCPAETIRLPATQDNSIVMVDGEWEVNAGRQGRIRLKGNQHMIAMSFDTTAVAGRSIRSATLICEQADHVISGVTVSTIATPWDETRSNGRTCGIEGIPNWGYPGAWFPAVCGGNGNTLVASALSELSDGTYSWKIPPDMVSAMICGAAYGLAIHEHDADYSRNPTIYSREQSGRGPYLLVDVDDTPETPPASPTELRVVERSDDFAILELQPPQEGLTYAVEIDGVRLARHNIPFLQPNAAVSTRQRIMIRDLPSEVMEKTTHRTQVTTIGRTGKQSRPATLDDALFETKPIETPPFQPRESWSNSQVSVIPVTDKYDEAGRAVGSLPTNYRSFNSIYDGRRIRLLAAAGEVVGFQTLLRGNGRVRLELSFQDISPGLAHWQSVYVPAGNRRIPDPLLPLPELLTLSPDQDTSVITDIAVPFDAKAGVYSGMLTISDGRKVDVILTVLPFSIPRSATFLCEMNGYGLPDDVTEYQRLQQIAYDHRTHVNILHYSHHTAAAGARKTNLDMRLPTGRRMNNQRYDDIAAGATTAYWEDFRLAFQTYLDGSLFQNGHRGPVPAPGFYLSFHESWPLNCRAYFDGNPDAYVAFRNAPEYSRT
ncbi:MAG: hypothetical protein KDA96_24250, partial [Planctomycetaceae bacterium]|nr:hypothetical protein [Planctomycetaceae bacterium]